MTKVKSPSERGESLADRVLAFAAMAGAVGGAIGGAALGMEAGTAFPLVCGTLGTMLGSGLAAGGWCLLIRLWSVLSTGNETHQERDDTVRSGAIASVPSAG